MALLQQAIQLCDELPCLGSSWRQGQQQAQQQQQPAGQDGQDKVIVPDTEECGLLPSPPKSASAAAATSPEPAAAGAANGRGAGPQQAQQQHSEQQRQQDKRQEQQPVRSQERKRHLGELRAAQEQQRALQAGLTQDMEDEEGHRMSGKRALPLLIAEALPGSIDDQWGAVVCASATTPPMRVLP